MFHKSSFCQFHSFRQILVHLLQKYWLFFSLNIIFNNIEISLLIMSDTSYFGNYMLSTLQSYIVNYFFPFILVNCVFHCPILIEINLHVCCILSQLICCSCHWVNDKIILVWLTIMFSFTHVTHIPIFKGMNVWPCFLSFKLSLRSILSFFNHFLYDPKFVGN